MKILFVYPDIGVRGGAMSYPFGIGMISACLKQAGHETRSAYLFRQNQPDLVQQILNEYKPEIVAFSSVSPQYKYVKDLLGKLDFGGSFTVLGGQHATLVPEECLKENTGLNAVCIGEGEEAMVELADKLKKGEDIYYIKNLCLKNKEGKIICNSTRPFIEDLDKLPFTDRSIFDYQKVIDSDFSTALFMFSRGCPYDCTFCANHALRMKQEGRYVRFRGVASCLAEIEDVVSKYKVKILYFNDDCFTARKDFLEEFCNKYPKLFKYPFDINARPETVNDDICQMLKEAGCRRISIGIENGSEQFRREVLGRKQSNEAIVKAFECCKKAGIKTKSFNIIGFPKETPEVFQETIKLNAIIQPDSVILSVFEPYPGTKLGELCIKEGYIPADRPEDWYMGRMDTCLNMPQFPRKLILRYFRNFAYAVYKNNSPLKAFFYKIYYSSFGEFVLKIISPFKKILRRLVMGV
jgi:radical SAM superfamily enzyme YgiQ (UPF0313 family)